ncbi:MFS transporter [Paraburkholderia aspalathi]|uniref:MFS transporter n=1 Tax=Paraburkholderia aspalathi TaxID=1324617 RepID=UPI0038B87092
MSPTPTYSLPRILALPGMVRAQLGATLLNSASVIVKLFMPLLFRSSYALDFTTIGILMASYGAGCVIGAYTGGALTGSVESGKLTAACLGISGVLAMCLPQLPSIGWLFIIVPAVGAADAAFRPGNLRLVLEIGGPNDATWLQGLHRICFNLGVALAGIIAASLAGTGYAGLFTVAGISNITGCGLLVCYLRDRSAAERASTTGNLTCAHETCHTSGAPWTDRPFLVFVFGQLLALGVFDQMYGAFGLFLSEDYQLNHSWIGYLFAFNALLIVLTQMPATKLINSIGLSVASQWGTLLLMIAFPLLNLGRGPAYAVATMVCITAAEILLTSAWTLTVMNRSAGRDRGRYLGIFMAAWLGHSLYGPACGTWIYGTLGGRNLWWICALVSLVVWALHYRTIDKLSPARS